MSARHDTHRISDDEANYFALHLLMPSQMLIAEIQKRGGLDLSNERATAELARAFQVSPAMLGYRIAMLKQEAES